MVGCSITGSPRSQFHLGPTSCSPANEPTQLVGSTFVNGYLALPVVLLAAPCRLGHPAPVTKGRMEPSTSMACCGTVKVPYLRPSAVRSRRDPLPPASAQPRALPDPSKAARRRGTLDQILGQLVSESLTVAPVCGAEDTVEGVGVECTTRVSLRRRRALWIRRAALTFSAS